MFTTLGLVDLFKKIKLLKEKEGKEVRIVHKWSTCRNGILKIEVFFHNDLSKLSLDYMLTNTLKLLFCGHRLGGAR